MHELLITISLLVVAMVATPARPQNSSGATYEVYALSYGIYPNFPVTALLAGADKDRKIDLQMMAWLLKGPGGKNILVDTGCYHENVVRRKRHTEFDQSIRGHRETWTLSRRHNRRHHHPHALGSC